jgi:hypothetical protein
MKGISRLHLRLCGFLEQGRWWPADGETSLVSWWLGQKGFTPSWDAGRGRD